MGVAVLATVKATARVVNNAVRRKEGTTRHDERRCVLPRVIGGTSFRGSILRPFASAAGTVGVEWARAPCFVFISRSDVDIRAANDLIAYPARSAIGDVVTIANIPRARDSIGEIVLKEHRAIVFPIQLIHGVVLWSTVHR